MDVCTIRTQIPSEHDLEEDGGRGWMKSMRRRGKWVEGGGERRYEEEEEERGGGGGRRRRRRKKEEERKMEQEEKGERKEGIKGGVREVGVVGKNKRVVL